MIPATIPAPCIPPWRPLTTRDLSDLSFGIIANDAGLPEIAGTVFSSWEKRIGVSDYDRLPVDLKRRRLVERKGEQARSAAQGKAARQKSMDATLAPEPDAETKRLFREADEARLQAAQAAESSRRLKEMGFQRQAERAMDQADTATRTAERLERAAGRRIDVQMQARWSSGVLAERAELSATRGESVVDTVTDIAEWVRDSQGVVIRDKRGMPTLGHDKASTRRVESSRGLMLALEKGDLQVDRGVPAEQLWHVGTQYRDAYEVAGRLLSAGSDPGQPSSRQCTPSLGLHDSLFEAFTALRRMRGQPLGYDLYGRPQSDHALVPLSQFQIAVLDHVCGLDHTIRATAGLLKRRHATVKTALVEALTVAKSNLSNR